MTTKSLPCYHIYIIYNDNRQQKEEDVTAINGLTFDMVGQRKDVYINERMLLETPSKSESDFDSEYKKFDNRDDIPF